MTTIVCVLLVLWLITPRLEAYMKTQADLVVAIVALTAALVRVGEKIDALKAANGNVTQEVSDAFAAAVVKAAELEAK